MSNERTAPAIVSGELGRKGELWGEPTRDGRWRVSVAPPHGPSVDLTLTTDHLASWVDQLVELGLTLRSEGGRVEEAGA